MNERQRNIVKIGFLFYTIDKFTKMQKKIELKMPEMSLS
jgi:hypothetical protein